MKKELLPHQRNILNIISDQISNSSNKRWGYMLEPGLGKTKLSLDTALLLKHKVSKIILVIPPGLKANWMEEIKAETSWDENYYSFIPYSALSLKKVSKSNAIIPLNALVIFDESHYLKNPKSQRTKSILSLLKNRNDLYIISLTGTPNPRNILDLWIQCKLVNGWTGGKELSHFDFSNMYGQWLQLKNFRKLIGEKNRDILMLGLKDKLFFLETKNVLDLPPQIYDTQYYELSSEQKKLIKNLKKESISQVEPSLDYMTATIHNYLMLCSGFISAKYNEEGDKYEVSEFVSLSKNPKLELLKSFIEGNEKKCIIFCAYKFEISLITEMLDKLHKTYTVRKGDQAQKYNQAQLDLFKAEDIQYLISTIQITSEGHNIVEADTIVYFSNVYDLKDRIQSERRIWRIGQTNACTYIDLVGVNAPDKILLDSLMYKKQNMTELFSMYNLYKSFIET